MMIILFYILGTISLLVGSAAIYMALIQGFPVSWLYYHYFLRKPINWCILLVLIVWSIAIYNDQGEFPFWTILPITMSFLGLILTYKMHQENAFKAIDFPKISISPGSLPLMDDMEMAVIAYEGETKCYPLDYVIHHHIINDRFGSKIVALTYCAMCRSIIPFDVTDIGPLFVGSFKNANMIVADRKTKTFFQQATFQSIIGKLHPSELKMIPFQTMTWAEVKKSIKDPQVAEVTANDFREFELPIPGVWKKIIKAGSTPGLPKSKRDHTLPARTRVIGITDQIAEKSLAYKREDILNKGILVNEEEGFFLIATDKSVNGFKLPQNTQKPSLSIDKTCIVDKKSGSKWNMIGSYLTGPMKTDLELLAISDEYWFSWKNFHPETQLLDA